MTRHPAVIVALVVLTWTTTASTDSRGERYVGTDWTWFTDYIYLAAEWTLEAESGCELEAGIGVKFLGKPRGGINRFSGHYQFTTYGFGAIHVRAVAGEAPCLVKLSQGNVEPVGVYGDPSVIKGAIRDGKIIYDRATGGAGE